MPSLRLPYAPSASACAFPQLLEPLTIVADEDYGSVTLRAVIYDASSGFADSLPDEGTQFFQTTLTAGADGLITMPGFDRLVHDHMQGGGGPFQLGIYFFDDGAGQWSAAGWETASGSSGTSFDSLALLFLPCRTPLPATAEEWCVLRPLSLINPHGGSKQTAWQATERLAIALPLYSDDTLTYTLSLTLPDGTAATADALTAGLTLTSGGSGAAAELSWCWASVFPALAGQAASGFRALLTVAEPVKGRFQIEYEGCSLPAGWQIVEHLNPFNRWETLLFATVTAKRTAEREGAWASGQYYSYYIEDSTTFEAVSPALSDAELPLYAAALLSPRLRLQADGRELRPTDGTLEAATDPEALPRLQLTWREAARTPQLGALSGRTFDDTFDQTFY